MKQPLGPWEDYGEYIQDEDGQLVCHFNPPYWPADEVKSANEVEPIRNLILAAPDMLDALEKALPFLKGMSMDKLVVAAELAIQKAKGEPTA